MAEVNGPVQIAPAERRHLDALLAIEARCFEVDRLSRRSFKHWLDNDNGLFLVALVDGQVAGYGLVINHPGTLLARLYSLAVLPGYQGQGIAVKLLLALEQQSIEAGRLYMRLEVAKKNARAIALYKQLGYQEFGEYQDYYDDHDDAIRMQKSIWQGKRLEPLQPLQWYGQTTDFSCGPASLMMAMSYRLRDKPLTQAEELSIWRTSTTVFMTSGHGGTHPFGLALAACERGFAATVRVNDTGPLFLDSVRSEHKKSVMTLVHNEFERQIKDSAATVEYEAPTLDWIEAQLAADASVIVLISTFQLDKRKAPHWVAVTHMDKDCIYVHDPDVGDQQRPLDCQHMPIARTRFNSISVFGKSKLRTAVAIKPLSP
ncbi:Ribosomal-protein-alanine N-acetyltransferase [Saliniradius amylolyticus]|uniref:Ribosomal-protein-alanine N-acetyltransferase n=1 Tax=Saliniradius amylolyticus TaxID=2183582 RepID=A0A2S2E4F3_9ALTE|nr:GNAT family N-acetyltransferase/peptidase C39 family protein [Saliniradius amylolyticus]AWL12538.1 Ribosomal-protein-alanine N-acetyltransferase [Saliniradius amylolyticus]